MNGSNVGRVLGKVVLRVGLLRNKVVIKFREFRGKFVSVLQAYEVMDEAHGRYELDLILERILASSNHNFESFFCNTKYMFYSILCA